MSLKFVPRLEPSRAMLLLSPVLAVVATLVVGALVFTALGYDGIGAARAIFFTPLTSLWRWYDLLVKAAPLAIIAIGLSIGFRANVWNIGAEGQYVIGALAGTGIALATLQMQGPWILPAMIVCGVLGGMAYAAIPAFLRVKLGVSEILSSLMLNYVAIQFLYYMVRGPWRNPMGFGFPQTAMFSLDQTLPRLTGTVLHLGIPVALALAITVWFVMVRTIAGFQVRLMGLSPQAARYGGFRENRIVFACLLAGGAFAGLAGILEAAGPFGQMVPTFPTGYGFTAIIAAFLGRLHPIGIVAASLVLALTYVGGESAQTTIGLPAAAIGVFQAMLLFFLLASDIFIRYRLTFSGARKGATS